MSRWFRTTVRADQDRSRETPRPPVPAPQVAAGRPVFGDPEWLRRARVDGLPPKDLTFAGPAL